MGKTDITKVLTRGVENILPDIKGLKSLMQKKNITLYQGFDPSSPNLHIGHLIGIRKLAQFQNLGHKIIFLIGDFTGMVGDPTDKSATRKILTKKQVLENTKGYKEQIEKILKFDGENPAEIKFNSEWLSNLSFEDVVEIASNFTVQQMLERDFFQDRIKNDKPIHLHEFLYPLMVSYDCVFMDVDLEIGGNDQLFNMMAGRTLMKSVKNKEKYVLTMKLFGTAKGKKMSKSEGFTINLSDSPENLYGSMMTVPDSSLNSGIELLTDLPLDFANDNDPLSTKKRLALEVVSQIYDAEKAKNAQSTFKKTFQEGKPDYKLTIPDSYELVNVVAKHSESKSDAKRKIKQGGIDINDKTTTDPTTKVKIGDKIKIGSRVFIEIE